MVDKGTLRPRTEHDARGATVAIAWARDLGSALALLTLLPLQKPSATGSAFGRATVFFPLVGLLIGSLVVTFDALTFGRMPQWCSSILVVAFWEALSGAQTLRAWGQCLGTVGRAARRMVARDSAGIGFAGGAAIAAMVAAKLCGVQALASARFAALLFAPALARWCVVVLAVGARSAEAPGQKFASAITFREFAVASVFIFAVVFATVEALGIFIVVCVATLAVALRLLLHHWLGGVSWHWLLAAAQLVETVVVALFAWL